MSLTELTDYHSGKPVLIDLSRAIAIVPLEAYHCDITGTENDERTRIDMPNGMQHLVKESVREIEEKMCQTDSGR